MAQTRSGTKSVNEPNQKSRGSLSESLLQRNQRNQRSTTPRETRATSIGAGENFFQVLILKFDFNAKYLTTENICFVHVTLDSICRKRLSTQTGPINKA